MSESNISPVNQTNFQNRHIGVTSNDLSSMLEVIGVSSLSELISQTIPKDILSYKKINLPPAHTESQALQKLAQIIQKNQVYKSYIGMGYYPTVTPPVIQRNILENPGWYTQYTPYQAEIAQGRLEALLNFQTMVCDLTGMPLANASLLDEATAASEAMSMAFHLQGKSYKKKHKSFEEEVFSFSQLPSSYNKSS